MIEARSLKMSVRRSSAHVQFVFIVEDDLNVRHSSSLTAPTMSSVRMSEEAIFEVEVSVEDVARGRAGCWTEKEITYIIAV